MYLLYPCYWTQCKFEDTIYEIHIFSNRNIFSRTQYLSIWKKSIGYRNWYFININYFFLHDFNFLLPVTNYYTFFKAHSLSTFTYCTLKRECDEIWRDKIDIPCEFFTQISHLLQLCASLKRNVLKNNQEVRQTFY